MRYTGLGYLIGEGASRSAAKRHLGNALVVRVDQALGARAPLRRLLGRRAKKSTFAALAPSDSATQNSELTTKTSLELSL